MKYYLVFAYAHYYPCGGSSDLVWEGYANNADEARAKVTDAARRDEIDVLEVSAVAEAIKERDALQAQLKEAQRLWNEDLILAKRMRDKIAVERDEARAAFDKAMEYATNTVLKYDGNLPMIHYTKPRPVAPWKGE